jgi:hypothetical protein
MVMAYLGWIIGAIVLGMMTFPVLQFVPSKNQKRQMAFRQAALRKGINIQMRHPDLPKALASEYPELERCTAYFKPQPSTLNANYVAVRSNNGEEWFWINERRPPAAMMAKMLHLYAELPRFCEAIEQNSSGSTVFLHDHIELNMIVPLENTLNKLNVLISQ